MNAAEMHNPDWRHQYDALVEQAGVIDLGHRTQIEISGADRAIFLHNLCTNEVRRLSDGTGCEAFLCSVQGKTLAHGFIFASTESLLLDTVGGQSETILKHLDHYLVCEQVSFTDRSAGWSELLLGGADSERLIRDLTDVRLAETRLAHGAGSLADRPVSVRRAGLAAPIGFLISLRNEDVAPVLDALVRGGAMACERPALEAARIEWGFPLFGLDISDKNLPQEVARDAQAVSFTKGCYLGQETVARIDALGHVNRSLVGVAFNGSAIPPAGTELLAEGQTVGQVTSSTYSPLMDRPLALGYVRRGSIAPGTQLTSEFGEAVVVALPVR